MKSVTPEVRKPTKIARDYWDTKLENNPLRVGDKDTGAGAFLAQKIENAGDILREVGKDYPDTGYIGEKISAIRRELESPDWVAKLSSGEWERLVKTKRLLTDLPSNSDFGVAIKQLIRDITQRDSGAIAKSLDKVEQLAIPKAAPVTRSYFELYNTQYSLKQLQEIAKSAGLSPSGLKQDLINRLAQKGMLK